MIAVIFDTETTGLIDNHTIKLKNQPHVIEFYGCQLDIDAGEIIREVNHLIKPPIEIPQKIEEITGITNIMVSDASSFNDVASEIISFLESADQVIGHNLAFDMEMIDLECERIDAKVRWPRRRICTVEQTAWLKGYRIDLSTLHEMMVGSRFEGAHRAKADVEALTRCVLEMHKREWI